MATATQHCLRCKNSFTVEYEPGNAFSEMSLTFARICQDCFPVVEAESKEQEKADALARVQKAWDAICPPEISATDLSHPNLAPSFVAAAQTWRYSSARGLGFIADTGKGKTRLLFHALRRAHFAGYWATAISHVKFRKIAIAATAGDGEEKINAINRLDRLQRCEVLLIDDIGKAPSTEAVDSEFMELIDIRTTNKRPILWSSNAGGDWLIARFGEDRGRPLVRRLAEFTEIIKA